MQSAGRVFIWVSCTLAASHWQRAGDLADLAAIRPALACGEAVRVRRSTPSWRASVVEKSEAFLRPATCKSRLVELLKGERGPSDNKTTLASSTLYGLWRDNALTIVLVAMFLGSAALQIYFGHAVYNEQRQQAGRAAVSLGAYLTSGHFVEALFENWESEFLQMGVFILIAVKLRQKGSTESRPFDQPCESDEDPRGHRGDPEAPWPVRRGGWVLRVYEHSLSLAFFGLFAVSFVLHAIGGQIQNNEQLTAHGKPPQCLLEFVGSSQFWFESFQNWQSEFLAIVSVVVLSIFLRERGSPQSKPVAAPHSETGA